MANSITLNGRLTADPELRFTSNGKPVATFTVADDYGHRDRNTKEWVKDGTTFLSVEVWDHLAEECSEKLSKGQAVVVVGEVRQRQYETRDGEKRSAFEVKNVSAVGPLLRRYPPKGFQSSPPPQSQDVADPWGEAPGPSSEPPF